MNRKTAVPGALAPGSRPRIGLYCLDADSGGGQQRRCLTLAQALARTYDVVLIVDCEITMEGLERFYGLDLNGTMLYRLPTPFRIRVPTGRIDSLVTNLRYDFESIHSRRLRSLRMDVFLNCTFGSNLRCPAPYGIYMCMFPHAMKHQAQPFYSRLHSMYKALVRPFSGLSSEILDTYQVITANSEFTAAMIGKKWNRQVSVVYSAPEDMGPPGPKQNIILNVGRFVGQLRTDYKHQLTLLDMFRTSGLHLRNWELHFAGSIVNEDSGLRTLQTLRRAAEGLPVSIHTGLPLTELRDLYRRAAIYWHATGYGTSAADEPIRQEHFGLTTVEAMSAGVVPVVIDSGGQQETVEHGVSGFRWNSLTELQEYTGRLVDDPALRERMSRQALARSRNFGRAAFIGKVEQIVQSLLERGDQSFSAQ